MLTLSPFLFLSSMLCSISANVCRARSGTFSFCILLRPSPKQPFVLQTEPSLYIPLFPSITSVRSFAIVSVSANALSPVTFVSTLREREPCLILFSTPRTQHSSWQEQMFSNCQTSQSSLEDILASLWLSFTLQEVRRPQSSSQLFQSWSIHCEDPVLLTFALAQASTAKKTNYRNHPVQNIIQSSQIELFQNKSKILRKYISTEIAVLKFKC